MLSPSQISVVIITRDRPAAMLSQTLGALARQTAAPSEVLVVDTSEGAAIPSMVAAEFPGVRVLHLADGPRCMPWSRNQGVAATRGEVVAFLDDDAIPEPQWLAEIARAYGDGPRVGGVGGRIVEGINWGGNGKADNDRVAVLDGRGIPKADFNSVTPGVVEVEHLKGCNMSFRRSALCAVGGFDEFYTNIANREETDLCVRVRRTGYRLLYNPRAAVEHKGFSLFADKRVQLESVGSGFPVARLEGYYVAKNFGAAAWARWYVRSNAYAFARALKATYLAFARALLGVAGGVVGFAQARNRRRSDTAAAIPPNLARTARSAGPISEGSGEHENGCLRP